MYQGVEYNQTLHDLQSAKKDERIFIRNECKALALEIDSFTMSIFRFFSQDGEYDIKETYDTIAGIDHWCKGVKNQIYMIQLKKYDEYEPSVFDATPSPPISHVISSSLEIEDNLQVLKETSQRIQKISGKSQDTLDPLEECVQNIKETETNLQKFQHMMDLNDIREIFSTNEHISDISDNSLKECVQNIKATESNLRKFQNMVNLNEILPINRDMSE